MSGLGFGPDVQTLTKSDQHFVTECNKLGLPPYLDKSQSITFRRSRMVALEIKINGDISVRDHMNRIVPKVQRASTYFSTGHSSRLPPQKAFKLYRSFVKPIVEWCYLYHEPFNSLIAT